MQFWYITFCNGTTENIGISHFFNIQRLKADTSQKRRVSLQIILKNGVFTSKNACKIYIFYVLPHDRFRTWRSLCGYRKDVKLSQKKDDIT